MNAAFVLILTMLAAGQLCARLRAFPEGSADALNRFVIYVCLPALVLKHVPKLHWDPQLYLLALAPWLALLANVLLVLAASRVLRFSRSVLATLLLCVPLGNTSFLGFPMVAALIGEHAVPYAVVYDQLGSFLILSTYGLYIVARFSSGSTPTLREVGLRILKFPPFVALCVALLPLPELPLMAAAITRVGDALVPLAMFAVGMKLELRPSALKEWPALLFGLGAKMVFTPLLIFALTRALGSHGVPARVALLESAMPPMITAGALAAMAGFAPELAAALVGYGVLIALLSLPMIAAW